MREGLPLTSASNVKSAMSFRFLPITCLNSRFRARLFQSGPLTRLPGNWDHDAGTRAVIPAADHLRSIASTRAKQPSNAMACLEQLPEVPLPGLGADTRHESLAISAALLGQADHSETIQQTRRAP